MYDTIIIGGGAAGLTAGLYAARGGLKAVLMERMFAGGQAATTHEIENYPGFIKPVGGPDLMMQMCEQAVSHGLEIKYEDVTAVDLANKRVNDYTAKTIIIATGAQPRLLGLENEGKLRGAGVSYCATCDGNMFKGKPVAVVGGGDTAAIDSLYLSQLTTQVYLIHRRDSLRAAKALQDRIFENSAITVLWDSVVEQFVERDSVLAELKIKNVKTDESSNIAVNGVFVAVGTIAVNELFKNQVEVDDNGYIVTDKNMCTSVAGVYAAGDIRNTPLRQVVTACADGAIAATSAIEFILKG